MTLRALRERLAYWQDRLNLKEWTITLQWGSARGMKGLDGCVVWSAEQLSATVSLNKGCAFCEPTLVHELCHLVLQGHEIEHTYDVHLERAINRLTAALMEIGSDL